jgi:hypothetical protein
MSAANDLRAHKPREPRRRVAVPARMRMGAFWSDACILNVSSRGMMIQASRAAPQGCVIEIWRGDHVIVARIVWRQGVRAGLETEERVPVEDILSLSREARLQLVAPAQQPAYERRSRPRRHEQSRSRARVTEFAGVALIAVSLAGGTLAIAERAFAKPLAIIAAALAG